jgi:hypothetical protein
MQLSEPKKQLSERKMREFLEIQSHERFANLLQIFNHPTCCLVEKGDLHV